MKYLILMLSLFMFSCSKSEIGTCYNTEPGFTVKVVNVTLDGWMQKEYMLQVVQPKEISWIVFTLEQNKFNKIKQFKIGCPND